jgi:hypothetical protein
MAKYVVRLEWSVIYGFDHNNTSAVIHVRIIQIKLTTKTTDRRSPPSSIGFVKCLVVKLSLISSDPIPSLRPVN